MVGLYGCLFGIGKLLLGAFRSGVPLTVVGVAATILVARRVSRVTGSAAAEEQA